MYPEIRKMLLRGTRHSSYVRPRMEIESRSGEGRVLRDERERQRGRERVCVYAYHEENVPRNVPRGRNEDDQNAVNRRGKKRGKKAEADARPQKKRQLLHPVHPTILSLSLKGSCLSILCVMPLPPPLSAAFFTRNQPIRLTKYPNASTVLLYSPSRINDCAKSTTSGPRKIRVPTV